MTSTVSFGSRAQLTTFLAKIEDATTGNKDGIIGNEDKKANETAPSPTSWFDKNPLLMGLRQSIRAGLSSGDENQKCAAFLQATEKAFGAPVTSLQKPAHLKDEQWNAFKLDKAIQLIRFDRKPSEVTEHVVAARGSVDGEAIAPRDVFVQRFAPQGKPSGQTFVMSPGFLETGRNFQEQADLLTKQGHAVVVMDHQWAGLSQGAKGGIDRGFGIARDVAAVTAWAAQQYPAERLTIVGVSMGGGAGVTGALLMNDLGKLKLDGPQMPKGLNAILQGPFFDRSSSLVNNALATAGSIPLLRDVPLPATGMPILSGDQATLRKLAAHATTEELSGRAQAFHASTKDLARMKSLLESGQKPSGNFYVLHAEGDTLADYKATTEWVKLLGPQAQLQSMKSTSHVFAENPAEQQLIFDGIAWLAGK